ncbi:rust resistance kinase Lr10-like [Dendrobium catenatum]|uniref:Putative receptor-like protein kinase n=1 Tax=Dendrobium catenatum TaxID=906689 RepID=A0A2I0VIW0_9ASPA|nr:rust resistance kinase Lr10-like [Dendrobium catenatum]PKU63341.1 putative receptor-like protein kinase [Dendrobium catenatum]
MPWYHLLLLGIFPIAYALSNDCPSPMCGDMEIKFPFTLESSSNSCRTAGASANLSCSSTNETIITLPSSESYRVTSIDYDNYYGIFIQVLLSSSSINCPWRKGIRNLPNVNGSIFTVAVSGFVLLNCTTKLSWRTGYDNIVGPISCLSEPGSFVYALTKYVRMGILPSSCIEIYTGEFLSDSFGQSIQVIASKSMQGETASLYPNVVDNFRACYSCSSQGKKCGYNIRMDKKFCYSEDSHHGIAICTSLVIFLIVALVVLYYFKKYRNKKQKHIKVEKFLATYKSTTLTRYNFADIKKMTKKFKHKLGQGGFGSVYKGELTNGIPVAVKLLEASKFNGDDFVNEVATIGKIHHVNVVRLLGFCSNGTNRALVYEFMPNNSLEKYIFLGQSEKRHDFFTMEKLHEIAIGIAQGINYLHQGCNQRIVHFDIKPHNILLDYDFNPKISDFGLAKLCSRDQSIVIISAARGTMGYIAPEVYSRNFGPVSHKSDVYSYGMLLLEMIGRRKNIDPTIENLSEIYFPEWIYNKLVHSNSLGLALEMEGNEEIMKRLAIIALWCIQWNPAERPSMRKVVQMLTMIFQSLEMPPTPFVPSSDQSDNVYVSRNHKKKN